LIDPNGIQIVSKNTNTVIKLDNIPEYDFITWDLENEKEFRKYISTIEKEIRHSYEYKEFISYIKDNYDMHRCSFLQLADDTDINVSLNLHHTPLTLYDIVNIVYRKRVFYGESLEVQMVAKEVMMLHYRLLVGLIPLSKTVHDLVHDSKIFINANNVLGNYREFVRLYKQFMSEEELSTIEEIERYSTEESDLLNTTILDMNMITFNTDNKEYQLPNFNNINTVMQNRIQEIKSNQYVLPVHEDIKEVRVDDNNKAKDIIQPFYFINNTK
jgi:hypothetical protein